MISTSPRPSPFTPGRRVVASHPLRRGMLVAVEFAGRSGYDYVANRAVTLKTRTGGFAGEFGLVSDGVAANGAEYNSPRLGGLTANGDLTVAWSGANISGTGSLLTLSDGSASGIGVMANKVQRNSSGATIASYTATVAPSHYVYTQLGGAVSIYAAGKSTPIATAAAPGLDSVTLTRIWVHKNTYLSGSQASAAGCLLNRVYVWNRALSAAEAVEWMVNYHRLYSGSPLQRQAILSGAAPSSAPPWMIDGDFPSYGYVEA